MFHELHGFEGHEDRLVPRLASALMSGVVWEQIPPQLIKNVLLSFLNRFVFFSYWAGE